MRAIVARPRSDAGLLLEEVDGGRSATADEAVVQTEAISLNQGEVRRALKPGSDGARPGWDFVGVVVERTGANGEGPGVGERVVGFVEEGAWCERVVAPAADLAVLPPGISATVAATLPVAGLTALYALAEGGLLVGKCILVNGASGGVGHLAVQLGRASGAQVIASAPRISAAWR